MSRAFLSVVVVALVAICGVVPSAASAAPPEIVTEPFTFTFEDEFLTEACGVPVITTVQGRATTRTFQREGTGPLEVRTVNATVTFTSGDNTVRLKDVGADVTRRSPDGRVTILVAGRVTFQFIGSQLLDADTEAVLRAAKREFTTDRVCAALTA
jgi:hypothetical protein